MSTKQTEKESLLASEVFQKFKDSMLAKAPYTERWMKYLNAWNNSLYEDRASPSYKSNQSSNFIFSLIESMRPIMFDSDPKFEALPVTADSVEYSSEITQVLDYEWSRTKMRKILMSNSIYTLTIGTSIIMLNYNMEDSESPDGNVEPIPVNPFNLYPDPLATSVDDAEYIIYATYIHKNVLKKQYPEHAKSIEGGDIEYSELVNYRDEDAQVDDQVLVLEYWGRDYSTIEEQTEDGESVTKKLYGKGRVLTVAPDLNLILDDKENPYDSGRFPFFIFKDIDIPFQFWGEGEVRWLLSPQETINDLSNQIIDNARHTANAIWVIDKNSGIPKGTLTNRQGLVVRKNPGSQVDRPSPPSMPMYVSEKISSLKVDMEVISGIHDVTRGQNPTGLESGAAIMALQEAAQSRVRLKMNLQEEYIAEFGQEWLNRIKQFWTFNKIISVDKGTNLDTGEREYDFLEISKDKQLAQEYKVKIIGTSTMSISNSSMFDMMLNLAQTTAEDGMPIVTREAVLDFLPKVNKDRILYHFKERERKIQEQQQQEQMQQEQMANIQGILSDMAGNMKGLNTDLGDVQGKLAKDEEDRMRDELKSQGYEIGMKEGMAITHQGAKDMIPEELLQELESMDDEELMAFLEANPEMSALL